MDEPGANRVVESFLEGLAPVMHSGAQQALRILVQRYRGSHRDSMMVAITAVKMRIEFAGRPPIRRWGPRRRGNSRARLAPSWMTLLGVEKDGAKVAHTRSR